MDRSAFRTASESGGRQSPGHLALVVRSEIDLQNPPEEPPREVKHELLWRLAVRLLRDHQPETVCTCVASQADTGKGATCMTCRSHSPCSGQRMALLGLSVALGT